MNLTVTALVGIPEIRYGDDLASIIAIAAEAVGGLRDGDILVVTSKIVSKAAGLSVPLADRMAAIAASTRRVVAERATATGVTRVVESTAGPVMAAAGVDSSNTGGQDVALLLPDDPDSVADALRRRLEADTGVRLGVVLSDTAGRPWRAGQVDFALGASGVPLVDDLRGGVDADGRALHVTTRVLVDEIAAAADLVKGKTDAIPAALVRGLGELLLDRVRPLGSTGGGPECAAECAADASTDGGPDGDGDHTAYAARSLVRTGPSDWFRLGHVEAVRAALGVAPGTPAAIEVGVPSVAADDLFDRIERACRVATHPEAMPPLPVGHPRAHRATYHPDIQSVRTSITQTGVRIDGPDELVVGLVTGRVVAALAGESIVARITGRTSAPASVTVTFEAEQPL